MSTLSNWEYIATREAFSNLCDETNRSLSVTIFCDEMYFALI